MWTSQCVILLNLDFMSPWQVDPQSPRSENVSAASENILTISKIQTLPLTVIASRGA